MLWSAMEESIVLNNKEEDLVDLPPGFRFHPTDEEIITHYLSQKIMNPGFRACAVGEVDLNKCEPWDMPRRAKMGEKEWYFFCQKDRKYPTGTRTNRATESGYWKATGKDKEIYKAKAGGGQQLVGMKKTLVFYRGRAPKGEKTNWIMHEFRLEGKLYYNLPRPSNDDWAVCRIFHKTTGLIKKDPMVPGEDGLIMRSNSYIEDDLLDYCSSPPPLRDPTCSGFTDAVEDNDFKFKGVDNNMNLSSPPPVPRSSDGNYFYFPSQSRELQDQPVYRNNSNDNNNNYEQMMSMLMNPISSFRDPVTCSGSSFQGPGSGQTYYKADQQQLSSKHEPVVSLSQDTSISTDVNTTTEISSSQLDNLEIFTGDSNKIEDITDMDSLWDF